MGVSPGTRFGPYEVLSPIGKGGMGEVYRAHDTRLGRIVALKLLPADRTDDAEARARFDREARAIAALSHPNVCAIHDVGLADGPGGGHVPYLVMEFLEGETLQQRLDRGAFDLEAFVEHAVALSDALDSAHARGLIHRDLKPANIFLTPRGPKILDFGLAKAVDPAFDETRMADPGVTAPGQAVGTIAYMSPEQLRGEPLDARTDIFSLGLVLYQMVTGQRAFPGATSAVISAGILGADPAPPRSLRADLPERLEQVIMGTLEKDRSLRRQSAAALRADLLRASRASGSTVRSAVASSSAAAALEPRESAPAIASPATSAKQSNPWVPIAAIGVLVVGAAWYWVGGRPVREPASDAMPAVVDTKVENRDEAAAEPATSTRERPATRSPAEVTLPATTAATAAPPAMDQPAPAEPVARGTSTPTPVAEPAAGGVPMTAESVQPGNVEVPGRAARGRGGRRAGGAAPGALGVLAAFAPQSFNLVVRRGNATAAAVATELRNALVAAGWTCVSTTESDEPSGAFAILAPRMTPATNALAAWARRAGVAADYRVAPRLAVPAIVVGPMAAMPVFESR